jgi:two-component sensor histidine kinase
VPSFLMQPFSRTRSSRAQGVRKTGIIAVRAAEEDGLAITVTDNGIGPPRREPNEDRSRAGVTCERLTGCIRAHAFSIRRPQRGTEVRLRYHCGSRTQSGIPAGMKDSGFNR